MAPEILQGRNGRKSYTEKADLWSLGCILYSLLSGTQAFNGRTNFELETAILNAEWVVIFTIFFLLFFFSWMMEIPKK